jgi:hypothetical protein
MAQLNQTTLDQIIIFLFIFPKKMHALWVFSVKPAFSPNLFEVSSDIYCAKFVALVSFPTGKANQALLLGFFLSIDDCLRIGATLDMSNSNETKYVLCEECIFYPPPHPTG